MNKTPEERKAYYYKTHERQLELARARYDPGKKRAYYLSNIEVLKQKAHERYLRNREHQIQKTRSYYQKNRLTILAKERLKRNGFKRNRSADRLASLKRAYGVTLEMYEAMKVKQNGLCAICGRVPEAKKNRWGGYDRSLHVDHCHETGVVRGLLCWKCNTGLGFFGHNIDRLLSAMKYLGFNKVPT